MSVAKLYGKPQILRLLWNDKKKRGGGFVSVVVKRQYRQEMGQITGF